MRNTFMLAAITFGVNACASDINDSGEQLGQVSQGLTVGSCSDQTFPLFRYYSGGATDHFYTTNFGELGGGGLGYTLEGLAGQLVPSSFAACGAVPLHRFYNSGGADHFYTTNIAEGVGMTYEGVQGYCFPFSAPGLTPLYRYYNGEVVDHFYTTNFGELGGGALGYGFEGVQCNVAP